MIPSHLFIFSQYSVRQNCAAYAVRFGLRFRGFGEENFAVAKAEGGGGARSCRKSKANNAKCMYEEPLPGCGDAEVDWTRKGRHRIESIRSSGGELFLTVHLT